jgi:hypothetical protein
VSFSQLWGHSWASLRSISHEDWGVMVTSQDLINRRTCDRRDRMHSRKASSRAQPQASASRLRTAANATSSASTTAKRDSLAAELERGLSLSCRLLI